MLFKFLLNFDLQLIGRQLFMAYIQKFLKRMQRKKQLRLLAKCKIELLIKQTHFPRDVISDIVKLTRFQPKLILKPYIKNHLKIMECVKWLILLHNLVFIHSKSNHVQIHQLLQMIDLKSEPSTVLEQILNKKMINPYKAYLLKRTQFSLEDVEPQFHCFGLINMLNSALCFTRILFTLGRYLFKKNHFLLEFNVIIAKDLGYLYKLLKYKMDDEFKRENESAIQLLNEGMSAVYYNCYFNAFVNEYAPSWINTGQGQIKSAKQITNREKDCSKKLIRTQKVIEKVGSKSQRLYDVSIAVQQNLVNSNNQIKSLSNIGSIRWSENFDDSVSSKKKIQQRIQFISQAELIIQSIKDI